MELSKDGKEELALALLLWKDFKCQGKVDLEFYKQMLSFADHLGVRVELEELIKKVLLPFRIMIG
ncbi:unnamed protein product [marine sediment metagenome]|uniref:Uncharacterized protein n=1 Tax=marine sediment metagenome TaxID=412755 RepID=X1U2X4_9ZZZZ